MTGRWTAETGAGGGPPTQGRHLSALISLIANLRAGRASIVTDLEIIIPTGRSVTLSTEGYKALTEASPVRQCRSRSLDRCDNEVEKS